jgi:hypothetical protein
MTRRAIIFTPAMFGIGLGVLAACQTRRDAPPTESAPKSETASHPSAQVAKAAETRPASRTWEARGVRVSVPAGWQEKKNPDYELYLVPAGAEASASDEDARITFDVPDLPPHLPWMIQMSRVEHDYEADLKKVHPDLKVDEASDVKMPGTIARLVKTSWRQKGAGHEDVALLMIHASGVYILDARAGEKRAAEVKAVFEGMRESIQWVK